MTGIFIAANRADKKMWNTLPGILQKNLPIVSRTAAVDTSEAEMILADLGDATSIHSDEAIIIFKEIISMPCSFPGGDRTIAVVDAAGDSAMHKQVSETMLPAITCGLSSRDTLTMSSMGTDSAVITLQRSITAFDGSTVEPQEIPIRLKEPLDNFALMSAAAVFLLTGNGERLKYADFDVLNSSNYQL